MRNVVVSYTEHLTPCVKVGDVIGGRVVIEANHSKYREQVAVAWTDVSVEAMRDWLDWTIGTTKGWF